MTIKEAFGTAIIVIILASVCLGLAGIWGFIAGDTAWQVFWSLVVVSMGLGAAAELLDRWFFKGEKK